MFERNGRDYFEHDTKSHSPSPFETDFFLSDNVIGLYAYFIQILSNIQSFGKEREVRLTFQIHGEVNK